MTAIQKLAWGYAIMYVGIVSLSYIPFVKDQNGLVFGLFSLQLKDDLLHLGSAIWAGVAAWHSPRQSQLYFKIFGPLYGLDGVLGLLTGSGYLDMGILLNGVMSMSMSHKIFMNIPHIIIGGVATLIGYTFSKKLMRKPAK